MHAERSTERLLNMVRGLIRAHDEERAAIARELHDHIDRLLLLSVDLERFRQIRSEPGGEISQEVGRARQQIENRISDIQAISNRLHNSKLEYQGLAAAAADFCKELSDQKKLEIGFVSEGIPKELPEKISLCLFHVLREAAQNATQHSGSRKFQVSLSVKSDEIYLTIRDSGVGFDRVEALKGPGLGLNLMKERLKLVDGELSIESQRERGTTIRARVPLNPGIGSAQAVN